MIVCTFVSKVCCLLKLSSAYLWMALYPPEFPLFRLLIALLLGREVGIYAKRLELVRLSSLRCSKLPRCRVVIGFR